MAAAALSCTEMPFLGLPFFSLFPGTGFNKVLLWHPHDVVAHEIACLGLVWLPGDRAGLY